jgi:soluble lytic murein transglycosylase-like protein
MQISDTPPTDGGSFLRTPFFPYRGGSQHAKHLRGLRLDGHTSVFPILTVKLRPRRIIARIIVAIAPFVCQVAGSTALESSAVAQAATRSEIIDRFAGFIAEASARFSIPASWIRAVMLIESGCDQRATSPRGALGLMQLMPGTWVELSARYGLGLDPFDPRDNILAGAGYLKEMRDRFGSAGFLAAYNAGPARYEQHLATGKSLPQDTIAYVAAVTAVLAHQQREPASVRVKRAVPWRKSPLFVERAGAP